MKTIPLVEVSPLKVICDCVFLDESRSSTVLFLCWQEKNMNKLNVRKMKIRFTTQRFVG